MGSNWTLNKHGNFWYVYHRGILITVVDTYSKAEAWVKG